MSERKTYFCNVKELVRHIEALLLEHDCVTVPQIGGFVTCNVPARYIEEECLFLPPYRTVGFNEQLKADDGLLVRSYADTYRIPEAEARKMLGDRIREMQQDLWENGSYDLGSIGQLTMNDRNVISFSPCLAGTVCPAFYGLDALLFPLWDELPAGNDTPLVPLEPAAKNKDKEITIRLKKSWLNNVAAVAAVVIMFFLFSPKAGNTDTVRNEQAEFTNLILMPPAVKTSTAQPVKAGAEQKETAPEVARETASGFDAAPRQAVRKAAEELSGFCVVVASAISEKNANAYVRQLHERGYTGAQVYKRGKMVRVIFPGFTTEAEAHAQMNRLSDESEEFAYAWVYEIK